jgi:ABC-type multidrug transport system ATPase subunit
MSGLAVVSDETTRKATTIALGFDSLVLKSPSKELLKGISGYVEAGGVTAIMGASASGKSVLLQALSGRIQDMFIGGKVSMNGRVVDPKHVDNPIAFVPQGNSVIGDLTAREVTTQTALFKRNEDRQKIDKDVDELLGRLGLSHVADGIIGTLIFVCASLPSLASQFLSPSSLHSSPSSAWSQRWTKETS